VPLRACRQIPDNKLLVTFNRAVFERAQRFDPNAWDSEGLQTDSVYRYDDTDPDNTRRNRRDRQPASLTPSNQSEAEADRGLTQRIRRAVSNNDALSLTSKNVKIITIAGKVTLRGPVRGQSEKAEIVRLAVQIAGAANVDDQMEVTR
jgi:osmotically-inducible protein OsmY